MGKRKQVSVAVKTAFIALNKNSSLTQKEIGKKYGIPQNTVRTIIKRHRESGQKAGWKAKNNHTLRRQNDET